MASVNSVITQDKPNRPIVFTIFGIIYLLSGVASVIFGFGPVKTVLKLLLQGGYEFFPPEVNAPPFFIAVLAFIVVSPLYFVTGVGFLKLKKWLPKLLITTVVVAFAFQINNYFAFPHRFNIESTLMKDVISLVIGVVIIWYTFKKKYLFNR